MKIQATKKPKSFDVYGKKDPRGPDNTITVWICDENKLHIRLQKPLLRCYALEQIVENATFIEIIQK